MESNSTIKEAKLPDDSRAVADTTSSVIQRRTTAYAYSSNTINIDIQQYTTDLNQCYWLAHVVISDPSQIHSGLSYDKYGGTREAPSAASARLGWKLGINGSYFSYQTGEPYGSGIVIKNSTCVKNEGLTKGTEICLKRDGTLFTPEVGITGQRLLDMGVIESWSTCDPLMISDGIKRRTEVIRTGHAVGDKAYPRTAIGMVKPCDYYIIVAGDITEDSGISFVKMQQIFYDLNCEYARSFDGGGSSALIYDNKQINVPKGGAERAVADFLYFTE